jgi:hypothetical protein
MTPREQTKAAMKIARKCYPLFKGAPPEIQVEALADLVARHLARHVAVGDAEATAAVREMLLEALIDAVRQLVPIVDAADIQPELRRRMQ